MSWKVPTPVNIYDDFGDDKVAGTLFLVLLIRAKNEPTVAKLSRGFLSLKRGQLVCGAEELSYYFKDHGDSYPSRQTMMRVLERLSKIHQKVDIKPTSIGTVVTIKNYDGITKMDNKWTTSGQQVDTNKNIKNIDNIYNIYNTLGSEEPKTTLKRTEVGYPRENYTQVLHHYQQLKGIELKGPEFSPVQQTIKSMFMAGRTPEQICRVMDYISKQDYVDWTIRTVKLKMAEFLPKVGFVEKKTTDPLTLAIIKSREREVKKDAS